MAQVERAVNKPCNPGQLEGQLKAQPLLTGLPISVYRTTGTNGYVIVATDLTIAQIGVLESTIAAHVADLSDENEALEADDIRQKLRLWYSQWDTATNAQKDAVMKKMLRLLAILFKN
jgi:hypothetical protein